VTGLCMFTSEVLKDMQNRGVDDGHIIHIGRYMQMRPHYSTPRKINPVISYMNI
jgi:hypothetical protein